METSTGGVFVSFSFAVLYLCRERSEIFQELGISQSFYWMPQAMPLQKVRFSGRTQRQVKAIQV